MLKNIARPAQTPRWTYNDWEPFETEIDAAQLQDVQNAVAQAGFGLFVVDDGWEQKQGDNAVVSARFPNGLVPVAESARKAGMEFGLWSPMAVVKPDAPVVRECTGVGF